MFVQCDSLWTKREETAFHGTFQIFDFFSNLIGAKVIHQRESGQSSGLYFSGATKGRVREPRTKKSWTPVSRDWPSLVAFANFFLAGRVHKPTMKVNIISRSDPVGRRSKQTANVVTRVGSKTCFVGFQTGNTSFFSDRVAVSGSGHSASAYAISAVAATSSSETSTKIMTETLVPSRAELGHTTTHFDASSARHYLQGVCVTAPPIRGEPRRIPGHTAPLSESRA